MRGYATPPNLPKGPLLATKWAKNGVFCREVKGGEVQKSPLFGSKRSTFWGSPHPKKSILATGLLVRGPDAQKKKKIIAKNFRAPFQTSKMSASTPPLFDMKIMGQLQRKSYKLHFPTKICGHFFSRPALGGSKLLRAPFLHQAPPNKCL